MTKAFSVAVLPSGTFCLQKCVQSVDWSGNKKNILEHRLFTKVFGLSLLCPLLFDVQSISVYLWSFFCPSNCPSRTFIRWCWSWKKLLVIIITVVMNGSSELQILLLSCQTRNEQKPFLSCVLLFCACRFKLPCVLIPFWTAEWKNVYVAALNLDKIHFKLIVMPRWW